MWLKALKKKGMSDDASINNQEDNSKSTILTLKITIKMPQIGWLEILSVVIIAHILGPKALPIALKNWLLHWEI